tara:strand:+ start:3749 stop:4438 length:690 start_codon:yes stop_codon:yes gene_type:complete
MTDDNDTYEESVLAAEYALGLLTPGEALAFEDVLSVDPDMRDHYATWAKDFATLTDDVDPVAPPPALEARISETLFGVPERRSIWSRFGLLAPVLGGLAAAAIVLVVLGQSNFLRETGPTYVAELAAEDSSLIVQATFNPSDSTLQMTRVAGGLTEDRSQELWLIAGENAPVSLGIWPNEQAQAIVVVSAELATLMLGGILAITDEPLGGSPTGDPTGSILAAGRVTLL